MANTLASKFRRNSSVAHRTVEGRTIIILPRSGEVIVLNETGRQVWELTDGKTTIDEIADRIAREFEHDLDAVRTDVRALYSELLGAAVVEPID